MDSAASKEEKELINFFLEDEDFIKSIELEIGVLVSPIEVDWLEGIVTFFGDREEKKVEMADLILMLRDIMRLQ